MRKIEVRPVCDEWDVYVNDKLYYCMDGSSLAEDILEYGFKDGEDPDDVNEVTYEGLEEVAGMYIAPMEVEMQDRIDHPESEDDIHTYFMLTPEEIEEVTRQLINAWAKYFDIKI